MIYEVYEVPNGKLDGAEELVEEFGDRSQALEFARSHRTIASTDVWVVQVSDKEGYEKVIST
jgi:hypothetical protein